MKLVQLVDIWFLENILNDWVSWGLVPGSFQFTNLITKYDNILVFHYFESVDWVN